MPERKLNDVLWRGSQDKIVSIGWSLTLKSIRRGASASAFLLDLELLIHDFWRFDVVVDGYWESGAFFGETLYLRENVFYLDTLVSLDDNRMLQREGVVQKFALDRASRASFSYEDISPTILWRIACWLGFTHNNSRWAREFLLSANIVDPFDGRVPLFSDWLREQPSMRANSAEFADRFWKPALRATSYTVADVRRFDPKGIAAFSAFLKNNKFTRDAGADIVAVFQAWTKGEEVVALNAYFRARREQMRKTAAWRAKLGRPPI